MSWTEKRIEVLTKLWKDGKSASEIAEELGGVTRNAVIGKAHRLGLSGRPSPIVKKKKSTKTKETDTDKDSQKSATKSKSASKKAATKDSDKSSKKISSQKTAKAKDTTTKEKKASKETAVPKAKAVHKIQDRRPIDSKKLPPESLEAMDAPIFEQDKQRFDKGELLGIMDLTERVCRWPIGDPKESGFGFCGMPVVPGQPYCAAHVEAAFQTSQNRKTEKAMKDAQQRAIMAANHARGIEEDDEDDIEDVEDIDLENLDTESLDSGDIDDINDDADLI